MRDGSGPSPRALRPLALTYHAVADISPRDDPHLLFVRPDDFRRHVERLRDRGYRLVRFGELAQLARKASGGGVASLTFDDGLAVNVETLVPLLRRDEVPATFFVTTSWLGRSHPYAPSQRIVTEDELRGLAAAGFEIGSHTVNHPDLARVPPAVAACELVESRRELERLLGHAITVAAYPYGSATASVRRACRAAGYEAACRTDGAGRWSDPFDLPRQAMHNRASLVELRRVG